jgi:hypothetical protein
MYRRSRMSLNMRKAFVFSSWDSSTSLMATMGLP